MAIYDDRLEQHPIWAALAAAREAVDRTRDKLADPEQIEIHAHVEAVLNYLEARLNGLDAQLVSFGPIDAIYNNLQQVDASLDQFEANPGNRAILDQADTQALGVLSYLGQLPEMSSTNEVENLREVGARYRRSMGGQVGQLTGEVNALKQTVQEVSQVALQQKAEIDAQAGRLEQTLAATENAFAQAQSVRQQGFEKQVGEFETELKERLETADGSVTASVKAHGEATQQALNDLKTRATAVWEEIDGLRERAQTASNYLGITSLAGGYSKTADAEEKRGFWLRLSAVLCFLGAIGVSAFALVYHVFHAFTVYGFFSKAAVSIPVLILAGYLAREASQHSERANFNRQRQRQLESLPAYVDALDPTQRAVLYEALAPGFFSPSSSDKRDAKDREVAPELTTGINLLVEALRKQQ
jgi:hypothetical protein